MKYALVSGVNLESASGTMVAIDVFGNAAVFNHIAGKIINRVLQGADIGQVAIEITNKYNVSEDAAKHGIQNLMKRLIKLGLFVEVS